MSEQQSPASAARPDAVELADGVPVSAAGGPHDALTGEPLWVEYLCVDGDQVLYVSSIDSRYSTFRLYVGALGAPLRELEVTGVRRSRDGGTTDVFTPEGMLHACRPSRLAPDMVPPVCYWPVQRRAPASAAPVVTRVHPERWLIVDDGHGPVVRPRA